MDEFVEVEWIILADYAEVIGNKATVIGGGWETLNINTGFPVQHPFAIAVAATVPWNLTNRAHSIALTVTDQDELRSYMEIGGQLEVGRPVGIQPGQPQRVLLAVKMVMDIQGPGVYVIKARVADHERRVRFNVVAGPIIHVVPLQAGGHV